MDFPLDPFKRTESLEFQYRSRLDDFGALEPSIGDSIGHRLLDLALRGDAEVLEKLADVHVEGLFIHDRTPLGLKHHSPLREKVTAASRSSR